MSLLHPTNKELAKEVSELSDIITCQNEEIESLKTQLEIMKNLITDELGINVDDYFNESLGEN